MNKNITQLHNVSPEEFKNDILDGVKKQLEFFSKNFKPKEPNIWISRQDAAELLGVSLVTIHDWCKKDILQKFKIGNRVRFKRSDIEQVLLNSNKKALK
ncbi:DNA binding domain-containing protein, excisionase family [Mesonia phycicola]|uniref:DNA binding domain-containing protein, excisionase family n=1 Tax=Mesonia phycicola TaxID=579105 RepID=A0A1M6DW68_9FLAO|nr:helix-turn-helix domain-containing protein [Mesonia phycicola]SHI77494.1 DNA binding domain-containing protein, excisionase family [Mesonia phycicola]